ncbi:MAG: hypothetical protein ABSF91_06755 [Bacteroidota bacterium]|jgi:Spy/CpxP family protein refolding chaperone
MMTKFFPRLAMLVVAICSLTLLMPGAGRAQRARMSLDDRVKAITDSLSLTKVQSDSVRIIYMAADSERSKIFEKNQGDRSAMRAAMGDIMKRVDAKIEALLTDEQKAKYEKMKQERPQMGGGRGRQRQD